MDSRFAQDGQAQGRAPMRKFLYFGSLPTK